MWVPPALGPQTHRHEEHGEKVDHGLHVEPPLGGDADGGEEGQAAEGGQEQFGHKRPHGLGSQALPGAEGRVQAFWVPRAEREKAAPFSRSSDGSCGLTALERGRDMNPYVEQHKRVQQLMCHVIGTCPWFFLERPELLIQRPYVFPLRHHPWRKVPRV